MTLQQYKALVHFLQQSLRKTPSPVPATSLQRQEAGQQADKWAFWPGSSFCRNSSCISLHPLLSMDRIVTDLVESPGIQRITATKPHGSLIKTKVSLPARSGFTSNSKSLRLLHLASTEIKTGRVLQHLLRADWHWRPKRLSVTKPPPVSSPMSRLLFCTGSLKCFSPDNIYESE